MNIMISDDAIENPIEYLKEILSKEFQDFPDGDKVFKGIQPREYDEFAKYCTYLFSDSMVMLNFIRKSPYKQLEPTFIHSDEMMGDITCILYLTQNPPKDDGTIFYNDDEEISCEVRAKFNRMVAFDSSIKHSRAIFDNYGEGDNARLIQVVFLKKL